MGFFFVGYRFQFGSPLRALHGILNPSGTKRDRSELTSSAVSDETTEVPDASLEDILHSTGDTASSGKFRSKFHNTFPKYCCLSDSKNLFVCFFNCLGTQ